MRKKDDFAICKRRHIQADFAGGNITGDGRMLLLRNMDHRLDLTEFISNQSPNTRKELE